MQSVCVHRIYTSLPMALRIMQLIKNRRNILPNIHIKSHDAISRVCMFIGSIGSLAVLMTLLDRRIYGAKVEYVAHDLAAISYVIFIWKSN